MPAPHSKLRHLPNALTILRLLMAVPIAVLVITHESTWALFLFIAAGVSDGLDGWLAKRFNWQSQLGGWLDPLADKALVLAVCIALTVHGDMPYWLLGLILLRDIVIVAGAITFHFKFAPLHAAPTLLGKLTMVALITMVVALLWRNANGSIIPELVTGLIYLVATLLIASGIDYVRLWSAKVRFLQSHADDR